ncbi:DUF1761 domain-containing protein [Leptospira wolffii]|uniref:DUF1761 domain-containing protein n=1 Tax=Leptospira wolffii TaxID=409998 RepID=UPI0010834667|nr:DUF1761 domain-containing protein [Leptospira wolffii]TGK62729.1 DUF1761 domain-containing protein [Leptospira wolffii]TGK73884.1 DUF1761 domain-containing protein [Leptospira wolffii]TGK75039.1 DUF1761 domain-containing protein [Leptospira wolffii]TGL28746.1 DUF1761 domain-containing protein [Leptospira wolffii]
MSTIGLTSKERLPFRIGPIAILSVGLLAFIASLLWYSPILFGGIWMEYRNPSANSSPLWMLVAPLRELIVSYLLAKLFRELRILEWKNAILLSFQLWLAFHAVGMAGAVIWDNMNWKLAGVHAGDWLMKMILMSVLLCYWNRRINEVSA